MYKVIGCLLSGLVFSAGAFAGPGYGPGPGQGPGHWEPPTIEERVGRLTEELGLNEEQAAQVTEIFTAADEEREALRAKHEQLISDDICALKDSVDAQLGDVLTAEQASELDALMEERAKHREEHDEWRGRGHRSFMDCDGPDA